MARQSKRNVCSVYYKVGGRAVQDTAVSVYHIAVEYEEHTNNAALYILYWYNKAYIFIPGKL